MAMSTTYYFVEPELAGGLGKHTVMDRSTHPPRVDRLHYDFDGWPDDVLLESFPCFIVTESARSGIEAAQLTGVRFDQVEVTASEDFKERHPNRQLPPFLWMRVEGKARQNDFGTAPDGILVVSGKALGVLQSLGIDHAVVREV
jgi:hypothetical protein